MRIVYPRAHAAQRDGVSVDIASQSVLAKRTSHTFAMMPARAISDARLSAGHLRVLGVVALHDRAGANGQGCYAQYARLAKIARCNYSNFVTIVSDLERYGYICKDIHQLNRRLRVLRVVYNAEDGRALNPDTLPTGNGSTFVSGVEHAIGCPEATDEVAIHCLAETEVPENADGSVVNIFREAEIRNSVETEERSPRKSRPLVTAAPRLEDDLVPPMIEHRKDW